MSKALATARELPDGEQQKRWDFEYLANTAGVDVNIEGDTSHYTTTGRGSVLCEGKEYPIKEQLEERENGADIFRTYVDFGAANMAIRNSERAIHIPAPNESLSEPTYPINEEIARGIVLPTREQILSLIGTFSHTAQHKEPMMHFCYEHGLYEIFTKEYIEQLAGYLAGRIRALSERTGKPVNMVEIGAGDGRLTHFLEEELKRQGVTDFHIQATDGNRYNQHSYPVEVKNAADAMRDLEPVIVLCSWMPKDADLTEPMRRAPSVQEYILIGPKDSSTCGEQWKTWGEGRPPQPGMRPPYAQDGFEKVAAADL